MIKVLMLGWELPPKITGGLGTACDGFLQGFAQQEQVKIKFVMPRSMGVNFRHGTPVISDNNSNLLQFEVDKVPNKIKSSYSSEIISEVESFAEFVSTKVRDHDFDIVHAHDWLTIPAALILKEAFSKPLVLHLHSCEFDRSGPVPNQKIVDIEQSGIRAADSIIVVSELMKRRIIRNFDVSAESVSVIHNSTNVCFAETRTTPSAKPVVSFIGRMTYQKGPLSFVDAAKRILSAGLDAQFVMAGDGDMLKEVVDRVRMLGLMENFVFKGFIDQHGVIDLLSETDVFVMPSVSEPFGIVALEAAVGQVPCILSKYSGVTEVLRGVIKVDPFDIADIADSIIWCIKNDKDAKLLAKQAFDEAKYVTWDHAADQAAELYRGVLKSRSRDEALFE